jgi:hypothetical protein
MHAKCEEKPLSGHPVQINAAFAVNVEADTDTVGEKLFS